MKAFKTKKQLIIFQTGVVGIKSNLKISLSKLKNKILFIIIAPLETVYN